MRGLIAALLLLSCAACHTVSATALKEAHVAASIGDTVLGKWDSYDDTQKKKAIWKLTRAEYSVMNTVDGTAIPDIYTQGPWATEMGVAPVKS